MDECKSPWSQVFNIHWNRSELNDRVCRTVAAQCLDSLHEERAYTRPLFGST